MCRQALSLLFI